MNKGMPKSDGSDHQVQSSSPAAPLLHVSSVQQRDRRYPRRIGALRRYPRRVRSSQVVGTVQDQSELFSSPFPQSFHFLRDCLSSQQLVDFVHRQLLLEKELSAVCERILDLCFAPSTAAVDGCDNMAMILMQFYKRAKSSAPAEEQSSSIEQALFELKLEVTKSFQ